MRVNLLEIEHSSKAMSYVNRYGRLNGWYLANKMNLPTQNECFIIADIQDIKDCFHHISREEMLYCRADSPWGKGNKLLRSRDIFLEELEGFYLSCKEICDDVILLVYRHPSVWITGHYIPRYLTTGAAQVLFLNNRNIIIEIVGYGFDCGDISRGKTLHYKLITDKDTIIFGFSNILKESRMLKQTYQITQDNYNISRKNRVKELVECYGEDHKAVINNSIPPKAQNLDGLAKIVCEKCVYPVLDSEIIWNNYVIMINIYNNRPYIYEMWQPKRSSID